MSSSANRFPFGAIHAAVAASLLWLGAASAQPFTHADSGWVKLFNGTDFKGIYSRVYGETAPLVHPPHTSWKILYPGTDTATIRVSSTAGQGNIGTDTTRYSHYRMRVEGKFDVLDPDITDNVRFNAGITYHTDETAIRMRNNWPRSIEFQMLQGFTGSAYSIQQVTFDTKASAANEGAPYSPTGTLYPVCEFGCGDHRRWIKGNPTISNEWNGKPRWLRYELVARGADSAIQIVNDTVVMRLANIRIFNDATQAASNKTPNKPWDHGGIGLQSEGALVEYRRWEIMEFPAGTPKGENYLHRFFLDSPDRGANLAPGSTYAIKWRTLGPIPTVSIQYSIGTGAWQGLATDLANTGTYDWTVPATKTDQLRVRITGPAWAASDSSSGYNAIGPGTSLPVPDRALGPVSFSIAGEGEVIGHIEMFSRLEIRDVFGRDVRDLAIQGRNLVWDRRDARGAKVRPGIYFLRLSGPGTEKTVRHPLF